MKNAVNWFEIPVTDYDRAATFYATVMGVEVVPIDMGDPGFQMGMFATENSGVGGGLMKGEGYVPSMEGSLVYLNGGDDLLGPLSRVEAAGGQVLMPKQSIGDNGFIAYFQDTEGNKVALHSMG